MKNIIILVALLSMSGCSSIGKWFADDEILTVPTTEKFTLLQPTQPNPIALSAVEFNVLSKQAFMKDLMETYELDLDAAAAIASLVFEDDVSLFTMNAKNYGNLGENMQEILRFIKQQKKVVEYYHNNVPTPDAKPL